MEPTIATPPQGGDSARRYARAKRWLLLLDLALTAGFLILLVGSGWGKLLGDGVRRSVAGWPLQVAIYATLLGVTFTVISFPLDWLHSFFLEHRFGLSTLRFTGWLWEYAKRLAVGGILSLLLIEVLSGLLRVAHRSWWAWGGLFWMFWSVLLAKVAPRWLIPIFYRQRPIEEPGLKKRLDTLFARCGTRIQGIFEFDLSRTTRKANAALCGWGNTRRVLVSDTLLSQYPPEEIEVILAHEVGHHKMHHLSILILVSTLTMALGLMVVDRWARQWMVPLGIRGLTDLAALPLIGLGLLGVSLACLPVVNGISRFLEGQADRYALKVTENPRAFVATMRRLAEQNLAELAPPRWVEWLLYDHPSIARRIALAENWKTKEIDVGLHLL